MGSIFGGSTKQVARPDHSELKPLTDRMYEQINNDPARDNGRQTAGQKVFQFQAGQALQNTLQGQAATRGIRSSQMASMANNALSAQQGQLAGQAAIRDAAEREAAQGQLAKLLMAKQGQIIDVGRINAEIDQKNKASQDALIGTGLSAAGMAFGGPAGAVVAGGLAKGLMDSSGNQMPTNMGTNPYATAPVTGGSYYDRFSYTPNQYSMGSALNKGGY